jgi:hypothetical protein
VIAGGSPITCDVVPVVAREGGREKAVAVSDVAAGQDIVTQTGICVGQRGENEPYRKELSQLRSKICELNWKRAKEFIGGETINQCVRAKILASASDSPDGVRWYGENYELIGDDGDVEKVAMMRIPAKQSNSPPAFVVQQLDGDTRRAIEREMARRKDGKAEVYTFGSPDPIAITATLMARVAATFFSALSKIGFAAVSVTGSILVMTIAGTLTLGVGLFVSIAIAFVLFFVFGVGGELAAQHFSK